MLSKIARTKNKILLSKFPALLFSYLSVCCSYAVLRVAVAALEDPGGDVQHLQQARSKDRPDVSTVQLTCGYEIMI